MSSTTKKGKGTKETDKKASTKKLEDGIGGGAEEMSEESGTQAGDTPAEDELADGEKDGQIKPQSPVPATLDPEPVYEEPVLTKLIVQSYDGPVEKGLYEGEGMATFVGGHHYKGHFSGGQMHGIGRYTWADGTVYEGEFFQNKITGNGKYMWQDDSYYEGEVLESLRHGFGIFISSKTGMSYQGEWKMGKKHGKGLMKFDVNGDSFYEGNWVENVRHGFGVRQYPSGNLYQGTWFNNQRHGEGSMRWVTQNQMYTGQWENGIQHGYGEHIWFFPRAEVSQYPMRNTYKGQFDRGLRHGFGAFYFANGATYEGEWKQNKKCGKGKFIFKNGRVYEGVFDQDHIVEYPTFVMDGMNTPDLSQIRTRTPLPSEHMSIASNESRNTYGPSFQLDMTSLMEEFAESERPEEAARVLFVIMRHISTLRAVYNFYSQLGFESSPDNTYIMNHMQFWRFLKDVHMHHHHLTLSAMDRILGADLNSGTNIHNPYSKILFREFINHLVKIAYYVYEEEKSGTEPVLEWCFAKMMTDNILKHACTVKGHLFVETRHSLNAMVHMDQAYNVYRSLAKPHKKHADEMVLNMRQFLLMLKDIQLINNDLTPKKIISILSEDDPNVADGEGCVNLELEMTFLEFFEGLVGCAEHYVTEAVVENPNSPEPCATPIIPVTAKPPGSTAGQNSQASNENENAEKAVQDQQEMDNYSPQRVVSQSSHKTLATDPQLETRPSNTTAALATAEVGTAQKIQVDGKRSEASVVGKSSRAMVSTAQSLPDAEDVVQLQSAASLHQTASEVAEEQLYVPTEDDDFNADTHTYNFWTHQVHIFFTCKFFPAAAKYINITNILKEKYGDPGRMPTPVYTSDQQEEPLQPLTSPADDQSVNDGGIPEHPPSVATASS